MSRRIGRGRRIGTFGHSNEIKKKKKKRIKSENTLTWGRRHLLKNTVATNVAFSHGHHLEGLKWLRSDRAASIISEVQDTKQFQEHFHNLGLHLVFGFVTSQFYLFIFFSVRQETEPHLITLIMLSCYHCRFSILTQVNNNKPVNQPNGFKPQYHHSTVLKVFRCVYLFFTYFFFS